MAKQYGPSRVSLCASSGTACHTSKSVGRNPRCKQEPLHQDAGVRTGLRAPQRDEDEVAGGIVLLEGRELADPPGATRRGAVRSEQDAFVSIPRDLRRAEKLDILRDELARYPQLVWRPRGQALDELLVTDKAVGQHSPARHAHMKLRPQARQAAQHRFAHQRERVVAQVERLELRRQCRAGQRDGELLDGRIGQTGARQVQLGARRVFAEDLEELSNPLGLSAELDTVKRDGRDQAKVLGELVERELKGHA
mmetsp:Transcript_43212/g.119540  ORF Transcript_43212/g.119540 Transcript_43212/m.119540 type:complete len:252 (+) Transcript_43212:132-887(+)